MARNNSKSKQKTSMIKEQTAVYTPSIQPVEKYNEEVYTKIEIQHLILFGIYSVNRNCETCTFERLVAECFQKFPKVFSFKNYPNWPDPLKFDRPLRTLREKGLIVGNSRTFFSVTRFGEKVAEETERVLNSGKVAGREKHQPPSPSDISLITSLRENEIFKRYLKNKKNFTLTEMELKSLLYCPLETPNRILKQNLQYCKNLAKEYSEEKLLEFLTTCEEKFKKGEFGNGRSC